MDEELISLTPDTFLHVLGLHDIERKLKGAGQRTALFRLAIEFLAGRAVPDESARGDNALGELPLKIPNTPFLVRLSQPTKDELTALLGVAAIHVIGSGKMDAGALTVAGIMAVQSRFQKLNADYGERSIVDALEEISQRSAREVTLRLNGHLCRYPQSNCRYRAPDGDNCAISRDAVEATLDHLAGRGILKRLTAVEPIEYGIVF